MLRVWLFTRKLRNAEELDPGTLRRSLLTNVEHNGYLRPAKLW